MCAGTTPVSHVSQLTNALLAAAGATGGYVDMGTNTGGVALPKGRAARPAQAPKTGGKPPPGKRLLSTEKIVERMRVSYPALRAARVDPALKQLFLAELISQAHND